MVRVAGSNVICYSRHNPYQLKVICMPNNCSMFAYYKSLFRCPCCLQNVNLDFLNKLVKLVKHRSGQTINNIYRISIKVSSSIDTEPPTICCLIRKVISGGLSVINWAKLFKTNDVVS